MSKNNPPECIKTSNLYFLLKLPYNIKTNKLIDSLYQDNGMKINFISDWMPKDNMIDYNSVLSNEEICNTYNELNKLL